MIERDNTPLISLFAIYYFWNSGNHEYYTNDVDNWLNYLRDQLGLTTLHNQHHLVKEGNATLCVTGIDDPQAEKMRFEISERGLRILFNWTSF